MTALSGTTEPVTNPSDAEVIVPGTTQPVTTIIETRETQPVSTNTETHKRESIIIPSKTQVTHPATTAFEIPSTKSEARVHPLSNSQDQNLDELSMEVEFLRKRLFCEHSMREHFETEVLSLHQHMKKQDRLLADIVNKPYTLQPTMLPSPAPNSHTYYLVQGPTDPLSNFSNCMIPSTIDGKPITYRSLEQGYHYRKSRVLKEPVVSKLILEATSPTRAKQLGESLNNHPHIDRWTKMETSVMKELLNVKFDVSKSFREKLLGTGEAHLYHSVRDLKWGIGLQTTDV